jgi:hypothetical protein
MYAVIAMPKHNTQTSLFNPHITIRAFSILLHLRLIPLSFLLIGHLLITASEEFGERDSVTSVFKG